MYPIAVNVTGMWQQIPVDDSIPCPRIPFYACLPHGNKQPYFEYFNKCRDNEIWVSLLEKVLAKVYGGYLNLTRMTVAHVMTDMTGAPALNYNDSMINTMKSIGKSKEKISAIEQSREKSNLSKSNTFSREHSLSKGKSDKYINVNKNISNLLASAVE